jgi:hypothetical protein
MYSTNRSIAFFGRTSMSDHEEGGCGSSEQADTAPGRTGPQNPVDGGAGNMNAYDIPRYNSEGYVLGRPETANDPTSAGMVQGAPAGGYQQTPQQPPGMQPPPSQGLVYAGLHPATGQPLFMAQPAMPGPPPPQGLAYAGVNPATGQPIFATPHAMPGPAAMGQPGVDPATAQAMPGARQAPPAGDAAAPGMDASHYGRIAEVVQDIANGEQPDVSKLAALYSSFDAQFWKGALIGAVLTVVLTNDAVKNAVAGTLGGIMGAFKKEGGASDGEATPESE